MSESSLPEESLPDPVSHFDPPRRPGSLGRLAHYEVESYLGQGGFGTVVKAFDEKLQRPVAIKLLASIFGPQSSARERFFREARAAATIRHENVVQIYAVEEHPRPYIVMEYVPGETLQDRLDRDGRIPVAEALTIASQVALGLAAAHDRGLVHRDIKPCNILLENVGDTIHARIADFGLALSKADSRLTQSGVVAGTPMFMAPEQASGKTLDGRADLFSLGSLLYIMLSGTPPFGDSDVMIVLSRIVSQEPVSLSELDPELPAHVIEIVKRMHAKKPEQRFQNGREVSNALLNALKGPPSRSIKTSGDKISQSHPIRVIILILTLIAAISSGLLINHFLLSPASDNTVPPKTNTPTSP